MTVHRALSFALCLALVSTAATAVAGDNAALAKAVRKGSDKSIDSLITAGQGLNEADDQGRGPLYYACARGDGDLISRLVDKGADVNARDNLGDTPLMVLVRNTFDVSPQALVLTAHGAKLDQQNDAGHSALIEAVLRGPGVLDFRAETALVKALLDAGADANLRDASGAMAAHYAAAVGEPVSMFRTVLSATHDPRATNAEGFDPLLVAVRNQHPVIARLMFQMGYAPAPAPPAPPEVIAKDPTHVDDHARVNAFALTWYGDYLAAQGRKDDAAAASGQALPYFDAAIAEQERAIGAVQAVLVQDERKRNNARAGTLLANAAGIALAAATGTGAIFILQLSSQVEIDQQRIKGLQGEEASLAKTRDDLKLKMQGI